MKKQKIELKKLNLNKETLANLNPAQQQAIAGGATNITCSPSCIYPCTTTTSAPPLVCGTQQLTCVSVQNPHVCQTVQGAC